MKKRITNQTLLREGFRPRQIGDKRYYCKELIRGYKLIGLLTRNGNFVAPEIYHPRTSLLNIPLDHRVEEEKHLPLGCKEEVNWLYKKAYNIISDILFDTEEVCPQDYC